MSNILDTARAIAAVLQPLTGNRSSGTATVRATPGPSAVLKPNQHAVPIVGGSMRFDRMVKTAINPDDAAGWTLDDVGTPVTMISLVGGAEMNLPIGTQLRWWPTAEGIEPVSVLGAAMTGAAAPTGVAGLKQIAFFEQLQANLSGSVADMFKSMVSQYPAALIVWEGSNPSDNDTVSPLGNKASRVGRGVKLFSENWDLFIITSRLDGDTQRREEGMALVEAVTDQLSDRSAVDGFVFSAPNGIQIVARGRHLVAPGFYVYRVQLHTVSSQSSKDARTFNDWLVTRLDADTIEDDPLHLVHDDRFPMT